MNKKIISIIIILLLSFFFNIYHPMVHAVPFGDELHIANESGLYTVRNSTGYLFDSGYNFSEVFTDIFALTSNIILDGDIFYLDSNVQIQDSDISIIGDNCRIVIVSGFNSLDFNGINAGFSLYNSVTGYMSNVTITGIRFDIDMFNMDIEFKLFHLVGVSHFDFYDNYIYDGSSESAVPVNFCGIWYSGLYNNATDYLAVQYVNIYDNTFDLRNFHYGSRFIQPIGSHWQIYNNEVYGWDTFVGGGSNINNITIRDNIIHGYCAMDIMGGRSLDERLQHILIQDNIWYSSGVPLFNGISGGGVINIHAYDANTAYIYDVNILDNIITGDSGWKPVVGIWINQHTFNNTITDVLISGNSVDASLMGISIANALPISLEFPLGFNGKINVYGNTVSGETGLYSLSAVNMAQGYIFSTITTKPFLLINVTCPYELPIILYSLDDDTTTETTNNLIDWIVMFLIIFLPALLFAGGLYENNQEPDALHISPVFGIIAGLLLSSGLLTAIKPNFIWLVIILLIAVVVLIIAMIKK